MTETLVKMNALEEEIARLREQLGLQNSKPELIPKSSQREDGSYISKVSIAKAFGIDNKVVRNLKKDFRALLSAHKILKETTIKNLDQNLERNFCETVCICSYFLNIYLLLTFV